MKMLKILKNSLLITCLAGVTIQASDQDISNHQIRVDRQKRLQAILKEMHDKQHEPKTDKQPEDKKFTIAAGVSRSTLKIKSTPNLQGHNIAEYSLPHII